MSIRTLPLVGILALTLIAAQARAADRIVVQTPFTVPTATQVTLGGLLDLPAGEERIPALVIAPGQGYHMDLPILRSLAERAAGQGVAVFRFNWGYCKPDGTGACTGLEPSADRRVEEQELAAVVAFAKAHPRVDATKILLAGKSLGSMVSYPVFARDPSLLGLFLLTPICTARSDDPTEAPRAVAGNYYANLTAEKRPVVFVTSDRDPNCYLPMLFDYLGAAKGTAGEIRSNVAVVTVGGDHSWNLGKDADGFAARSAANVAAGVALVNQWINLILGK